MNLDEIRNIFLILSSLIGAFIFFYRKALRPLYANVKDFITVRENKLQELTENVRKIHNLVEQGQTQNDASNLFSHNLALQIERIEARLAIQGDAFERPIFRCDAHGSYIYVNRAFCKMLDVGSDRLLQYGWQSFLKPERMENYEKVLQNTYNRGVEMINFPMIFTDEDGNDIYTNVSLRPVRNGKIHEFFGTLEVVKKEAQ